MFKIAKGKKRLVMMFLCLSACLSICYSLFFAPLPVYEKVTKPCKKGALFLHIGLTKPWASFYVSKQILRDFEVTRFCKEFVTFVDGTAPGALMRMYANYGFKLLEMDERFQKLQEKGLLLYEFPTLYNLWKYCRINPKDVVFYMHTLSSSKPWSLRRQMTRHVLQKQLIENDQECATTGGSWHCGPNAQNASCWKHYSGNFWKASCEYVNKLRAPILQIKEFEAAMRMRNNGQTDVCFPKGPVGRYWAEAWITHGMQNANDAVPMVEILGIKKVKPISWFFHNLFFTYNLQPLYFIDALRRMFIFYKR